MKDIDDFYPVEPKDFSFYGKFHFENIGFEWLDSETGKRINKLSMFQKYGKYPVVLKKLTEKGFDNYKRIKK